MGSYFENYIYLKLQENDLYYIYENGYEIDFYIKNHDTLIEAKFNSKLSQKQEELFNNFNAKKKLVVDSVFKLEALNDYEKY